jgi:hypothetical protein
VLLFGWMDCAVCMAGCLCAAAGAAGR